MTVVAILLALQPTPESGEGPHWRGISDLPLRLQRASLQVLPLVSLRWDIDLAFDAGAASFQVNKLSESAAIFGGGLGIDFGAVDVALSFHASRTLRGEGPQSAPGLADAEFRGRLSCSRLTLGLRAIGVEWGAPPAPPVFDIWLRPILEFGYAEVTLRRAESTLGVESFKEKWDATAWGAGLTVAVRLRTGTTWFGVELGWLLAGGRLGGSLDVEARQEIWAGLTLSMLPNVD